MVKKTKWFKAIFGKEFNIWDIIIILLSVPYLYMLFYGISYNEGWMGIYFMAIAPAIVYATIINYVVRFLMTRAKRH